MLLEHIGTKYMACRHLPWGKLTWMWKTHRFHRKIVYKWLIFHICVSLPQGRVIYIQCFKNAETCIFDEKKQLVQASKWSRPSQRVCFLRYAFSPAGKPQEQPQNPMADVSLSVYLKHVGKSILRNPNKSSSPSCHGHNIYIYINIWKCWKWMEFAKTPWIQITMLRLHG